MGVDIYGCSFTQERRAKHDLMEEIGLKAYHDLPQEEKPFDTSAPGAYFQRSYMSWRPIADMICDLFPDIAERCRYWRSSDGDGLNGHYALRLADELDGALKDGTVTDWHQDSVAWPMFAPQNHVSCWVALDDATVDNGCMTVIPGSHKWGPIASDYKDRFLSLPHLAEPVPVELKAGHCMFHHGLNFHRTEANTTPNRRRGLALHYIDAQTSYLGIVDEAHREQVEGTPRKGNTPFMHIRGKEFPGRV